MKQYPHVLTAYQAGTGTQDANGDWVTETEEAPVTINCRAESSNGSGYITGVDGTRIDFSWTVYMPLSSPVITIGSRVSIDANGVLINDTVKRFSNGQLNCTLWL